MSAEGSELESKSVMRPQEINVTFVSMLSDTFINSQRQRINAEAQRGSKAHEN